MQETSKCKECVYHFVSENVVGIQDGEDCCEMYERLCSEIDECECVD